MTAPRIAVVGAGLIGQRHVAQALEQALLAAIVDPSEEAAQLAQDRGVAHFTDLAACLENARPDGAVIATPNHLHAEQAVQCLEAGVPVLVEKPFWGCVRNTWPSETASDQPSASRRV